MTQFIRRNVWLPFALLLGLATSQISFAGINLVGGLTDDFNYALSGTSISLLLGAEATLNFVNTAEFGLFYDHNFLNGGYYNLAGAMARVGFGPVSGWFVDGKVGFSPSASSAGIGAGVGYHFNSIVALHGGVRLINVNSIEHPLGDLALMLFF